MKFSIFPPCLAVSLFLVQGVNAKDISFDPPAFFPNANLTVLSHFERAKIQSTWRGFYLRADTQAAFLQSDSEPSSAGIYLDVSERDGGEIVKPKNERKASGLFTKWTVELPAKNGFGPCRIIFIAGVHADSHAVQALEADIDVFIQDRHMGSFH